MSRVRKDFGPPWPHPSALFPLEALGSIPCPPLFSSWPWNPTSRDECSPPGDGLHHRLRTFCDAFVLLRFSNCGWLPPCVLDPSPFEPRFPDPLGAGHVFRAATRGSLPGSRPDWAFPAGRPYRGPVVTGLRLVHISPAMRT